jgi:hypothetical protein
MSTTAEAAALTVDWLLRHKSAASQPAGAIFKRPPQGWHQ